MTCAEAGPLLHARLDNELDMAGLTEIDRHLAECRACTAQYSALEHLREEIAAADLAYTPEPSLERKLAARFPGKRVSSFGWTRSWLLAPAIGAAAMAVAATVFLIPMLRVGNEAKLMGAEVLDNHLRSLQAVHQVDVPSSDQHTVKPWFQGKTDFSPPVPDLEQHGFVLVGGRLEVIHQQPAAAIVYRRRQHVIDLYVSPSRDGNTKVELLEMGGYHLLRWTQDNMSYWAVSDVDSTDLRNFADLIRKR
jgi:anti-sigma factor RsiW